MTRFAGSIDLTDYLGEGGDWSMATDAEADSRSRSRVNNIESESAVEQAGISAKGQMKAADYSAAAAKAVGQAKASATMFSGIADGISSIAGGGIAAYGRANNLGKYAKD